MNFQYQMNEYLRLKLVSVYHSVCSIYLSPCILWEGSKWWCRHRVNVTTNRIQYCMHIVGMVAHNECLPS